MITKTISDFNLKVLDKFPHVKENLVKMWGTPECLTYLESLVLVDTTRIRRQGFPFDTAIELNSMLTFYKENMFEICKDLTSEQRKYVHTNILRTHDRWKNRG